jgi:hypothetical protein
MTPNGPAIKCVNVAERMEAGRQCSEIGVVGF